MIPVGITGAVTIGNRISLKKECVPSPPLPSLPEIAPKLSGIIPDTRLKAAMFFINVLLLLLMLPVIVLPIYNKLSSCEKEAALRLQYPGLFVPIILV
jgi:hypothetical protein